MSNSKNIEGNETHSGRGFLRPRASRAEQTQAAARKVCGEQQGTSTAEAGGGVLVY